MYTVKNLITLVGQSGSGKSSIIAKYIGNYQKNHVLITFNDFFTSFLTFENNTSMKIEIVDTRGPERFRSLHTCILKKQKQ